MANLAYCRFRNTARDLKDCSDALEELLAGNPFNVLDDEGSGFEKLAKLSPEEGDAAIRLIQTAFDIVNLVADCCALDPAEAAAEFDGYNGRKLIQAMLAPYVRKS